ncbi:MAG TPA: tRNA uridine-5-carboxymethylaminomethyl(34) synthesis GTPase MnmE [Candidatus Binataceae bacterium]
MYEQDTIVAPATAPGAASIAVIRFSGPDSIRVLRAIWVPDRAADLKPRRLYLGEIRDPITHTALDRAMATIMPGPKSFTGEDVAELQCHGGPYLVRRVVALAMTYGARLASPGEFTRRAFLNGRIDLTEAEAIADLISARSDSALGQALGQLTGALSDRLLDFRRRLIAIRAHLEAEIDFSDEDIALPSHDQIARSIDSLRADLRILHDSFERGRIVRDGARAAIIGKPNAGKSSIMNLILGSDRAIVTPHPGTTRDVIEESVALGRYMLVIQDTAGLRHSSDPIERIGIDRAIARIADSDLILAIFDSSRALDSDDARVIEAARGRCGLAILNKRDLPAALSRKALREAGLELPILPLSALDPLDLPHLKDELSQILQTLGGDSRSEPLRITRERHRDSLARAIARLTDAYDSTAAGFPPEIIAVDITAAADSLGQMTGSITTDDVLDSIFREFCVGK